MWLLLRNHACLLRCIISFSGVAPFTRCYQVHPGVGTAPRTGYHMVQREIFFGSAILTFKVVALENILAREIHSFIGGMHIPVQPNHGRHGITFSNGMQLVTIGGPHQFALVQVHQNERTLHRTHHQWAKILIEYQNPAIH